MLIVGRGKVRTDSCASKPFHRNKLCRKGHSFVGTNTVAAHSCVDVEMDLGSCIRAKCCLCERLSLPEISDNRHQPQCDGLFCFMGLYLGQHHDGGGNPSVPELLRFGHERCPEHVNAEMLQRPRNPDHSVTVSVGLDHTQHRPISDLRSKYLVIPCKRI
jgi:hypothetical protein